MESKQPPAQSSLESMLTSLESGDVLLMDRKCFSMKDPLSIGLCLGAKSVSKFDHVGMVYRATPATIERHPATKQAVDKSGGYSPSGTYVLEANVGGVTLRSLEARLKRTTANEIAVRPVVLNELDRPSISSNIDSLVEQVLPYDYKSNLIDFVAMSLKPPDKVDRMMAAKKMRVLYNEIIAIREHLAKIEATQKSGTTITPLPTTAKGQKPTSPSLEEKKALEVDRRVLLKLKEDYCDARLWFVETYFKHLPSKMVDEELVIVDFDSSNLLFVDGENCSGTSKGVFCSELVLHLWQRSGILKRFPPATSYAPVDYDVWDDEFNFVEEAYGLGKHQTLYPAEKAVASVERSRPVLKKDMSHKEFMEERKRVMAVMYKDCRKEIPEELRSKGGVIDAQGSVVPRRWLVQTTTHTQLVWDMPEKIMLIGALYSVVGFALSPLYLKVVESQVGMMSFCTGPWAVGFALCIRSLLAAALQSSLTYNYLHWQTASQAHLLTSRDAKELRVMREVDLAPRTSFCDDRHPYYTAAALLLTMGSVATVATHWIEQRALYWAFGPDRPRGPPIRMLMKGAPLSVLSYSFSYCGGWLIWYECFGPVFFTTETSVMRQRPDLVKDERWVTQQRDAILGAIGITLLIDTVTFPIQRWQRRRFVRAMYAPEYPPARRFAVFNGLGKHLARSCAVSAITASVVWNFFL